MRQWTTAPLRGALLLCAVLLCLGACSGASQTAAPAPAAAGTTAASTASGATASAGSPSAVGQPSTPPSTASAAGEDGHQTSAVDVCAFLTGQIPALEAIGTPVGRQANLTGNLFGFLQSHHQLPDGAALDEGTRTQCPEVRARILTLTGLTSLQQL